MEKARFLHHLATPSTMYTHHISLNGIHGGWCGETLKEALNSWEPCTLKQELEKELKRARWEAIKLEETRRATEAEAQVSLGRHS